MRGGRGNARPSARVLEGVRTGARSRRAAASLVFARVFAPLVALAPILAPVLALVGCASDPPASPPEGAPPVRSAPRTAPTCPVAPLAADRAPDVTDALDDVGTWLSKLPAGAADEVLVAPARARELNDAFAGLEGAWHDPLADGVADPEAVRAREEERLSFMQVQVATGALVEGEPGALASARGIVEAATPIDESRVVASEAALFCTPLATGLYKPPVDRAFDRNRCASLHPGEVVRVVARGADGWVGVHAGHTTGWLASPVLTPPQPRDELRAAFAGRRVVTTVDDATTQSGRRIRLGTELPITGDTKDGALEVLVATTEGLVPDTVRIGGGLREAPLPLTRRALFTAAFAQLGQPYGWGGREGHRDCSRLVRDLFVAFGLQLPRHSGVQARVGTHDVDVSGLSEADKRSAIETWAARGIVLLYMPGHIMIYLGEDGRHQYALSAISEFLTPCPGGPDTVHRLDRVALSTLEVGRGTERTAFIERITRLVVFAPPDAADTSREPSSAEN